MEEPTVGQIDQLFARGPVEYPGPTHPMEDWVAITEYELREVAKQMPDGRAVPVQMRGVDAHQVLVLQANGSGSLPALVALARLRSAITGPQAQEPQSDAQETDQLQDGRLERAADDDLQDVVEGFMNQWEVDPLKFDHQNHAGDLVTRILGVLRRRDYLPDPVSADDGQRPPLRRMLNMGECSTLRHRIHMAAPAGLGPAHITEITGRVLSLLRSWSEDEGQ